METISRNGKFRLLTKMKLFYAQFDRWALLLLLLLAQALHLRIRSKMAVASLYTVFVELCAGRG